MLAQYRGRGFAWSFSAIIIFYLVCLLCDGVAVLEPGGAALSVGVAPEAIFCVSNTSLKLLF